MSPIQSPPDPFTLLLYRIYYSVKGLIDTLIRRNKHS